MGTRDRCASSSSVCAQIILPFCCRLSAADPAIGAAPLPSSSCWSHAAPRPVSSASIHAHRNFYGNCANIFHFPNFAYLCQWEILLCTLLRISRSPDQYHKTKVPFFPIATLISFLPTSEEGAGLPIRRLTPPPGWPPAQHSSAPSTTSPSPTSLLFRSQTFQVAMSLKTRTKQDRREETPQFPKPFSSAMVCRTHHDTTPTLASCVVTGTSGSRVKGALPSRSGPTTHRCAGA